MMDVAINAWAVVAAVVASMVIGMLWYGPVFGKAWMRMMGFTQASMKSMPLTPMQAMAGGVVTAALTASVLSWLGGALGLTTGADALRMAFWVWLGFHVPLSAGAWLWEGKSFRLFLFNAVQWLVTLSVVSSIVVLWK